MKVFIVDNYEQMSQKGAEIIADVVKSNSNPVLGLATGSTPIGTYEKLAEMNRCGEISFKNVRTVNLDEYVGLDKNSDQSYVYFMSENLFDKIDIDKNNTNLPSGIAADFDEECKRYSALLEANRQDIQLLGLGSNGHVGFNEPGTPFDSMTHIVDLTESTIKDNSRLFSNIEEVPRQAITMGIFEIMKSKKVLVLASGRNKANAVYQMVKGEISENCPATVLQNHPDCIVVVDKDAAALI